MEEIFQIRYFSKALCMETMFTVFRPQSSYLSTIKSLSATVTKTNFDQLRDPEFPQKCTSINWGNSRNCNFKGTLHGNNVYNAYSGCFQTTK